MFSKQDLIAHFDDQKDLNLRGQVINCLHLQMALLNLNDFFDQLGC